MVVIGLIPGFLIGVISGIVFLLLLKTANRMSGQGVLTFATQLLAIPTFGGVESGSPPVGCLVLCSPKGILKPYLVALAFTFAGISAYPAFRWIVQIGEELGERQG